MPLAYVIDDNREIADSLCKMLSLCGFEAKPVYGSRSAMIMVEEAPPDIIFLDISMPGVDGFEVLSYFRRLPSLAEVPIVVITVDDRSSTVQRAQAAGVVTVLRKPVSFDDLETVLADNNLL